MATQHNFRIKNGLEVGGVLIVNSSGQLQAASISGAISATSIGVTNIVTNKVVKFNGTILDDSNITDTGSLITLGSNTTLNGSLTLSSNSTSVNTRSLLARDTNGLNIGTTNATTAISIDNSANVTMPYNLVVSGNLTVNGTQTELNVATLQVEDKNITLNYGTGDTSGSANGAGITIQDGVNSTTDATILWNASSDQFDFSHKINVTGDLQAQNIYTQNINVLNAAGNGWHTWATRNNNKVDLNVGTVVGTTATFFADAVAGTNALNILSLTNGGGAGITFSDNGTPAASASGQNGYMYYYHGDSQSYGSGNAFILSSSESTTTILADGKLMYKEGLYIKPSSGTGAGTLLISSSGNMTNIGTIDSGAITSGAITATAADSYFRHGSNVGIRLQTTADGTGGSDGVRVGLNSVHAFVWNYEAKPLAFATSGTERLSIGATGPFHFKGNNLTNVGTISSGAITALHGATHNISISPTSTGGVLNVRNSSGTSVVVMDGRGTPFIDVTGVLKISAQTVIDASRNVTNISSLNVNHSSNLSGTQVYIKKLDDGTNLQRWGEGTSGQSTYRFRIDQTFKFIANSGSGDNFSLDSNTGNVSGVGTISSGAITSSGAVSATEYDLPSSGKLDWANGDARIQEGLVNNYSLSFQTYDGSNLTTALRLDGNNSATFAGTINSGAITSSGTLTVDAGSSGMIDFGNVTTAYGRLYADNSGTYIGSKSNHPLILRSNHTAALTLDTSQNATFAGTINSGAITSTGILTLDTSPAANGTGDLKVIPSANSSSGVGHAGQIFGVNISSTLSSNSPKQYSTWGGVTGATAMALQADDSPYGQFQVWIAPQDSSANTVLTPRFWIAGSGTATFAGEVLVSTSEFRISSSAAYTTHLNYQNGGNNIISQANGGATAFRNNGGDLFTIDSGGNLKLGTTQFISASRNLTNIGTISSGVVTATGVTVGNSNLGSNSSHLANITVNNNGYIGSVNDSTALNFTTAGDLVATGKLGVGTAVNTAPAHQLSVTAANAKIAVHSTADGQRIGFQAKYFDHSSLYGSFEYTTGDAQLFIDNNFTGNGNNYSDINFRNKDTSGNFQTPIKIKGGNTGNNGYVGIGATNPSAKLVVNVDAAGIKPALILNNEHEYGSGVGVASAALQFGRDNSPSNGQTIISGQIYSGNEAETTSNPCFMGFSTKSGAAPYTLTERMRINSSGNVGIGTTNPNSYTGETTLTINGTAFGRLDLEAGGTLRSSLFAGSTYAAWIMGTSRVQIENSSDIKFNTGNQTKMIVKAGGNVGIGTDNPYSLLEINRTASDAYTAGAFNNIPVLTLKHTNANTQYAGIRFTNTAGNYEHFLGSVQTSANTADMVFQGYNRTGGGVYQEFMRVKETGNVGIGNNPGAKLDIEGGSGGVSLRVKGDQPAGAYYYGMMYDGTNLRGTTQTNIFYSGSTIAANTTVAEYAGLRIDQPSLAASGSAVTNSYGIYQAGSAQKNYFAGKIGVGVTGPFSRIQSGSHTFSGNNGMHADNRVGISNHGTLTGMMLASNYNDANHPEYGLVFVQGPSTSSYNVWSISPDGPAKGNSLNFHYGAQTTNVHAPSLRKMELTGSGQLKVSASASTAAAVKLQVGTINNTGSSAIVQFGGFVRASEYFILHETTGSSNSLFIDYVSNDMDIRAGEGSYTGNLRANAYKVGTQTVINSSKDLIIGTQINFNNATNSSFIGAASTANLRYGADGIHQFDTYNGGWGTRAQIGDNYLNLGASVVLQMNGTTVIDASRNATLANIDNSGNQTSTGYISIKNANYIYFGQSSASVGSWKARIYAPSSTLNIAAQAINFNNVGYGSTNFFLANSAGFDIKTGALRINGTTVIDASRNLTNIGTISSHTISTTGNLVGASNNTTEIGTYSTGAIKRIRMAQGGELHFGDTTSGSPLGITEGSWDNFGDQDRLSIYGRSNIKFYSALVQTAQIDGSGNFVAAGNVTAYSDERLKTNIQTLDGKKALQMRGVSFTKDGEEGSGVIAQEIEKIAPELVLTADDEMGTKSVAYGNITGYLIELAKEQQKEIDELKQLINNIIKLNS